MEVEEKKLNRGLKVVKIKMVKEKTLFPKESVNSSDMAAKFLSKKMAELDREVMCVLNLNVKNEVINLNVVSVGTLNETCAMPREVFKSSILSNASSVILVHNNPSGHTMPSKLDIALTERLHMCGEIRGLKVLDHMIVGGGTGAYNSFRSMGLMSYDRDDKTEDENVAEKKKNKSKDVER